MFKKLIVSKAMRRRVSWTVAIILFLPFILFFSPFGQSLKGGPGSSAGVVFGKRIPWETFQEQQAWLKRQWENRLGDIPEALQPMLIRSTWDRIILLEEAKHRHLKIDDQELAAFIQKISVFQENNRFVPERYQRFLRASRSTPQIFERMLRNDLLVEKLVNAVKVSVTVSSDEVAAAYRQAHEQIRATLFVFEPASFKAHAAGTITDEALRAEYGAHPESVRIPEQITIEYAGASHEELAAHTKPTEDALQAFYQDNEDQFSAADRKVKPFAEVRDEALRKVIDEQARKQLTVLAMDLRDDLDMRMRFEEIVKTRALIAHTQGPLSVGTLQAPGGAEPEVIQAAAKLPVGGLSDVVTTSRGVYIARVIERIPSRVPPFDEVREEMRRRLTDERARTEAREAAEAYRKRIMEQRAAGRRFEEIRIRDYTIPAHPATLTRTSQIDDLGSAPAINEAAFRTTLGELTDVLESPSGFVIIRPEERLPADISKLDASMKATLREETLNRKQAEYLESWLKELRSRAKLRDLTSTETSSSP